MRLFDRFLRRKAAATEGQQNDPDALVACLQDCTRPTRERRAAIRRLGELCADRPGGPIEQIIRAWMSPETSADAANALEMIVGPGSFRMLTLFESVRGLKLTRSLASRLNKCLRE